MYLQNIDSSSTVFPFLNALKEKKDATEADLYPFIDEYIDTNVTDIYLNVMGQMSMTPSAVIDDAAAVYNRRIEDGYAVDHTEVLGGVYAAYQKFGDPFAVWIRRIREVGMRAHISFRMNDCHCPTEKTCWIRPTFFYTARDNGWMLGESYGYFCRALNYRFPEVRTMFLDYIREQTMRYDVDGIELDYMRDPFCFDYKDKDKDICIPVMNDFMRAVKAIVKEAEAHHGHPIEITVRLNHDIPQNMAMGFDPITWEKEGLVDHIIPSPRFQGSDSHLPIAEWKAALPKTKITACIERQISSEWGMSHNGFAFMTAEQVRGLAASYLAQGSDGIYTFNLYGEHMEFDPNAEARDKEVQYTVGSYEETVSHSLRFPVINQDAEMIPVGHEGWSPIPLVPKKDQDVVIPFVLGKLPKDKKGSLTLGFTKGDPSAISVTVNGKPFLGFVPVETPEPKNAMAKDSRCYAAPFTFDAEKYDVAFRQNGEEDVCISWIEIDAK